MSLLAPALPQIGVRADGRPIYLIMGGDEAADAAAVQAAATKATEDAAAAAAKVTETGFPADTPWRDMTGAQQVAYWQHQSKKHEARATAAADYDTIKAENERLKAIEQASLTEEQRQAAAALDAARKEGEGAGVNKFLPAAIRGEIRGANPGLTPEQVDGLMGVIDASKFLTADGAIDTAKVSALAATLTPPAAAPPLRTFAGQRPGNAPTATGLKAGADLFASRHGANAAA